MIAKTIFLIIMMALGALCFISLFVLIGSRFWWPLQKIYIRIFDGEENDGYVGASNYVAAGNPLPVLYLGEYSHMFAYEADTFKKFLEDNSYYLLIFPDRDIVLYHNDSIAVCSFYNKLLLHLARTAGYSRDIVNIVLKRGEDNCKKWEAEDKERQEKLDREIAEIKSRL